MCEWASVPDPEHAAAWCRQSGSLLADSGRSLTSLGTFNSIQLDWLRTNQECRPFATVYFGSEAQALWLFLHRPLGGGESQHLTVERSQESSQECLVEPRATHWGARDQDADGFEWAHSAQALPGGGLEPLVVQRAHTSNKETEKQQVKDSLQPTASW